MLALISKYIFPPTLEYKDEPSVDKNWKVPGEDDWDRSLERTIAVQVNGNCVIGF
jgi:hypothetical protein